MARFYTPWFWFGKGEGPERQGVYEVKCEPYRGRFFQHWNGSYWGLRCSSPGAALQSAQAVSSYQNPIWRGFRSEQKS